MPVIPRSESLGPARTTYPSPGQVRFRRTQPQVVFKRVIGALKERPILNHLNHPIDVSVDNMNSPSTPSGPGSVENTKPGITSACVGLRPGLG